jgi:tight adherence protein C
MSTSLLLIGAIAMFLAVFAIAYSVQTIVAERRQAYRTLQAIRAVEVRPYDLRNRELARPARERLLKPFYNAALGLTRRFTPAGAREAIRLKLIMAGSPFGWDPDRVLVAKVACLSGGVLLGLLFLGLFSFAWPLRVLGFLAIGLLGYWLPNIVLTNAVQRRQSEIRSALADSIDLLTICV